MIATFEDISLRIDITSVIAGSMDVKALFSILRANKTTDAMTKEIGKPDIKIDGVNWAETGKLLTTCITKDKVRELLYGRTGL